VPLAAHAADLLSHKERQRKVLHLAHRAGQHGVEGRPGPAARWRGVSAWCGASQGADA
jgi:hypothetical protein